MKKSYLFILSLLIFSVNAFAKINLPLTSQIQTINVFSGAPQPSDSPVGASGGFGDVAANLVSSIEIKKRYPQLKVRLLVTSAERRYYPMVPTTIEILKIMVPSLRPEQKGVVQMYQGVEVVFIDYDFGPALDENNESNLSENLKDIQMKVPRLVPRADLNVSFSVFPESSLLLRMNAPLAIGVEEQYGDKQRINEVMMANPQQGAYAELASGPDSMGFMLSQDQIPQHEALDMIQTWAQQSGFDLPAGPLRPVIAYTADWHAAQVYVDAIAALPIHKPIVLMVKDLPELDFSALPKEVHIVRIKGMPSDVMKAAIQESVLSPLVTGDISFGQALSSVKAHKTFVYEAPEWKVESSDGAQKNLAKDLGLNPKKLDPMFLKTEILEKLNRSELKSEGARLAKLLGDQSLQKDLFTAVTNRFGQWDLLGNTLRVASDTVELLDGKLPEDFKGNKPDAVQKTAFAIAKRIQGRNIGARVSQLLGKVKKVFSSEPKEVLSCKDLFASP